MTRLEEKIEAAFEDGWIFASLCFIGFGLGLIFSNLLVNTIMIEDSFFFLNTGLIIIAIATIVFIYNLIEPLRLCKKMDEIEQEKLKNVLRS